MKNFYLFLLIIIFSACNKSNQEQVRVIAERDIKYSGINLDTLHVSLEDHSGIGFFYLRLESLFFADQIYSKVHHIDMDGNVIGSYLGKGDSPYEQNSINGLTVHDDKTIIINDFQISTFNKDYERIHRVNIQFSGDDSYDKMLASPSESMHGIYQVDWKSKSVNTPFLYNAKSEKYILPIHMEHPLLNAYFVSDYYSKVAVLGSFDILTGKSVEIGGLRSDAYLNHLFLPNFDFNYFVQSGDEIFISFAIDHFIHVLDKDFNLIRKFGIPGIGINQSYIATKDLEEADSQFREDRATKGYYEHLWLDSKRKLLFRTYYPEGNAAKEARLQVYEGDTLAADIIVPSRFRVIGKIGDSYIADGIVSEETEELGIYKFTLR